MSVVPSGSKLRPAIQKELGDIEGDAKGAGDRSGEGFSSAFSGKLKAIGVAMAGVFAAGAVGGFLKDSISAASDLSESASKVGVVFGDAAGDVQAWAKNSATTLGQTTQQALEAAGTFGNLFTALKIGPDASANMSKSLVTLAGDLASFNNVDPAEALDALRSGLTGETEPLKRFGVNMNEATLQAKALELGLGDGKKQLSASAKAQAAYALIMEQTTTAQGDFARTSKGLANQQRILSAQWVNLKGQIGQALLPAVNSVLGLMTSRLMPALQTAADLAGPAIASAIDAAKQVIGPAIQFIGEHWQGMLLVFGGTGLVIGQVIKHFDDIKGSFSAFVQAFMAGDGDITSSGLNGYIEGLGLTARKVFDAVAKVIGDIPAAVSGFVEAFKTGSSDIQATGLVKFFSDLGAGIKDIYTFIDTHKDTFLVAGAGAAAFGASLATALQVSKGLSAASTGISALQTAFSGLTALFSSGGSLALLANPWVLLGAAVVALGVGAVVAYKKFKPFRDVVDAAGRFIKDVALKAWDGIKVAIRETGEAAQAAGKFFSDGFDAVKGAVQTVIGTIGGVASSVITALTPLAQWFNTNVVSTLVAGWDLIVAVFNRAKDTLSAIINGVLIPVFQLWATTAGNVVGVAVSAFQHLLDVAVPIFQAIWAVISQVIGFIIDVIAVFVATSLPVWEAFFNAAMVIAETVLDLIKTGIETVLGIIRGIFQAVTGLISGDWGKFWEGIQTIASSLFGGVRDTVSSIWDGIKGLFQAGIDAAKGFVSAGLDGIVGLFQGMPGRIAAAASGMFDGLWDAFRGAINAIVDGWNGFHIPGFSHTFDPLGKFGPSVTIDIPGMDFPNIPHLATGGTAVRAGVALVGEAGPEILRLPRGAQVQPLGAGVGAGTVNNIYLSGQFWGDTKSAARQIQDELRKLERSIG